jgi:hypothetical protein
MSAAFYQDKFYDLASKLSRGNSNFCASMIRETLEPNKIYLTELRVFREPLLP